MEIGGMTGSHVIHLTMKGGSKLLKRLEAKDKGISVTDYLPLSES